MMSSPAKTRFLEITRSRYDGMVARADKTKAPRPEFDLVQLREYLLRSLGMKYDGHIQCRYCRGFFTCADLNIDHVIPLARGGFSELSNIGFPCASCNQVKGRMLPDEMEAFMAFLELKLPLARVDILKRLKQSVKLAASLRNRIAQDKRKALGAEPPKKRVAKEPPPLLRKKTNEPAEGDMF